MAPSSRDRPRPAAPRRDRRSTAAAAPGVRADVGVLGDRILAVGDLSTVDPDGGRARPGPARAGSWRPGFIDPHGHSDGSLFLDGALASHLHQGFTTQLSGNCGDTPRADHRRRPRARRAVAPPERPRRARWATFGEYLDRVAEQPLGPNVAFLVGHGTVRGSVLGRRRATRRPTTSWRRWSAQVEAALDAGAIGLSTGLIYAPGMHADGRRGRGARRGDGAARRPVRDPHAQRVRRPVRVARRVDRGDPGGGLGRRGSRSRTSSAARASVWGRAGDGGRPARGGPGGGPRRRPPTSTRTRPPRRPSPRSCRRRSRPSASTSASRRWPTRTSATSSGPRSSAGISGWENVAADPGWGGLRISYRGEPPGLGRPVAGGAGRRAPRATRRTLAFDALRRRPARRLGRHRVHAASRTSRRSWPCPGSPSAPTPRAVGPGHPILDAGRPHPRTYGSTARVLGTLRPRPRDPAARDRDREAHLRPGRAARSARSGRRPRGRRGRPRRLRSRDRRATRRPTPSRRATRRGIDHVIVNGRAGDPRRRRDRRAGGPAAAANVTRPGPLTVAPRPARPSTETLPSRARRRPARIHAPPLAAVARPARRDPPGPRRGRDRAGTPAGAAGRDPERHVDVVPRRARAVAAPPPRATGARPGRARGSRRAARRRDDPLPGRPPSPAARARPDRASGGRRVERIGGADEDEIIVHVAPADRRSIGGGPRGVAQATGAGRDRARHRPPRRGARRLARGVSIRDQRTRWGSASRQGRLAFSWRLILAPPEALETVVIHELAHLRVFGHGPRFWAWSRIAPARPQGLAPLAARPFGGAARRARRRRA